jgi:hypothetical protein
MGLVAHAADETAASPSFHRHAGACAADGPPSTAACHCGVRSLLQEARTGLPLDSEHKACQLRLLSWAPPHMRSFHLAWLTHFVAMFGESVASVAWPCHKLSHLSMLSFLQTLVCS